MATVITKKSDAGCEQLVFDMNYLKGLLKDVEGKLYISNGEFKNINFEYKGYNLEIKTYREKLYVSIPSYYKYSVKVGSFYEFEPKCEIPKKYTFTKLTSKKLLMTIDFEIEKAEDQKTKAEVTFLKEKSRYDIAIKNLKFIADTFDVEVRITNPKYGNTQEARVYLTDYYYKAILNASWDEHRNEANVSSEIKDFVSMIKKIKSKK